MYDENMMKICMMQYDENMKLRCRREADRGRPQLGQEQQQGTKDIRIISGCQNCNKNRCKNRCNCFSKNISPVADRRQKQGGLRRAPTEERVMKLMFF